MVRPDEFLAPPHILQTIDMISDELGRNRPPESERRTSERKDLRVGCVLFFFVRAPHTTAKVRAQTRNISRRGLGIIARKSFHGNEPIEVWIQPKDKPALYAAGLVRFCRYISDGYYEVGIELMSAGKEPIFGENPEMALEQLPWLEEAIEQKKEAVYGGSARGARNRKQHESIVR